ncbi:50S ribosomal protein L1 [Candidatus Shikimatogenerans silvanidophilus]|uniref:50S ribosomal protein L1 n=1 Tax=Candidatus Shikimatogenerans silvanidophilus TaxID=2782547 RepID=UPI001BABDA7D|nr:50S ribosomal protein L1 [Candidatus Shikimatogenerans silvanidophilus]
MFLKKKKISKNQKKFYKNFDFEKIYDIKSALKIIKKITFVKFDSSINIVLKLGINNDKPDQIIRGCVQLPYGTGKKIKILSIVTPEKETDVIKAGSDYVGFEKYINKIKNGWKDFDVLVTIPSLMSKIGNLGKILGPKGLMPNPKNGTVSINPEQTILDIKKGKINFKTDRYGIIHSVIGKISFSIENLEKNFLEFIYEIKKIKPNSIKGEYIKSIFISSTMSKSIKINKKIFN